MNRMDQRSFDHSSEGGSGWSHASHQREHLQQQQSLHQQQQQHGPRTANNGPPANHSNGGTRPVQGLTGELRPGGYYPHPISPRGSRSDMRERMEGAGSGISTGSGVGGTAGMGEVGLPYPPLPGTPTSRNYHSSGTSSNHSTPQQGRGEFSRPFPYYAQGPHSTPHSPHSAGPNLSPGLANAMGRSSSPGSSPMVQNGQGEWRLPQRSATDPHQWEDRRRGVEEGVRSDGRGRSKTGWVDEGQGQGQDQNGQQGRGLGFGNVGYGVPGPGPNTTERNGGSSTGMSSTSNSSHLRIVPPSPRRTGGGRHSPTHRTSPTTPSTGGTFSAGMHVNVPLPPGSDTSHQSGSHFQHSSNDGMEERRGSSKSNSSTGRRDNSPGTGNWGYPSGNMIPPGPPHANVATTAPGPPVPMSSSQRDSVQTVTPSQSANSQPGMTTVSSTQSTSSMSLASGHGSRITNGTSTSDSFKQVSSDQIATGSRAGGSGSGTLPNGSICGNCGKPVKRQFVRAMGKVYHLDCFRCKDCDVVVAAKFFPVDDPDGSYPLCERDYFARLDLICGKCDKALRGSYITACNKKYHVEHFTCSACSTVFGPQDSYYEHDDQVYCHFHYSTRFATKCVGCANAILKQFVEINRNQKDECWHPECYMIHKFWNVKLTSKFRTTPASSTDPSTASTIGDPDGIPEEHKETAETLRAKQVRMEGQVEQIWRVLSAFEESSAACISEMLRFVSAGQYGEAITMAERFILHVEILFAAIDDLEAQFAIEKAKGMAHTREAKMLCRKTVNFFSLLSHTQESPEKKAQVTQELLALVTGLAHYLKILIRIALTGSLKLEREHGNVKALDYLLARLSLLAKDDGDPGVAKRGFGRKANGPPPDVPPAFTTSTRNIAYGYRSLALEVVGESVLQGRPLTPRGLDECLSCRKTIEEDCIRLGLFERWHAPCLQCTQCDKVASFIEEFQTPTDPDARPPKRRALPRPDGFTFTASNIISSNAIEVEHVFCQEHSQRENMIGFESVSRLEQFAFLLNVALRRLWDHLRHSGVISSSSANVALPATSETNTSLYDSYRDSTDIKRLKSVNLDRKLSATARTPQRSTVVESPSGKIAKGDGTNDQQRSVDGQLHQLSITTSSDSQIPSALTSPAGQSGASHEVIIIQPPEDTSGPSTGSRLDILRPAFGRANTHIAIVSDGSHDTPPDTSAPATDEAENDESPFEHEQGVTLADIPALVEAEQAKLEHRPPPTLEGRPLMSELSALDATIVKHFALITLTKSAIANYIDMEELFELVEIRKNQWWNKLFKPGKDKKDVKRKGVFGVPLEILVEKTGSDSQLGATNAQLRVPEFIDNVVSAMKQMDMSIEGIFRKNGNIKRLNNVAESLDRDATSVSLSDDNPVQLAALLKKFLRDLPDPLMTFRLHKLFCAAQHLPDEDERLRCLHLLVAMLPRVNRDTMEVLFVFLKWVASFSHVDEETGSRMDVQNLATVICPSILYSKGTNAMRDDSFVAIQAVKTLIDHQDEFYTVPKELRFVLEENVSQLFKDSLDLPPKEIFKHCSNYANARRPVHLAPGKKGPGGMGGGEMSQSGSGLGQVQAGSASGMGLPLGPNGVRLGLQGGGDYGLSSHRSDGNLVGTAGAGRPFGSNAHVNGSSGMVGASSSTQTLGTMGGSSGGVPSRPQSWAEQPGPGQAYYPAGWNGSGSGSGGNGNAGGNGNTGMNAIHPHPGLIHQHSSPSPHTGSSLNPGSPNSRRMWFPSSSSSSMGGGGQGRYGGSTPGSPVINPSVTIGNVHVTEGDHRPSSSFERTMSPSGGER